MFVNSRLVLSSSLATEFGEAIMVTGDTAVTILCATLATTETIDIQATVDGTRWFYLHKDEVQLQLTLRNNIETIYGPGAYRLVRSASTASLTPCYKYEVV